MADQNLREIQISSKQLVFLFMASVVLAVAVFLLGVSVGRGVRDKTGTDATGESAAVAPVPVGPMSDPGPTHIEPDSLKYPELSKVDPGANGATSARIGDATPQTPSSAEAPEVSEPAVPAVAKAAPPAPAPVASAKPVAAPKAAEPAPKSAAAKPVELPDAPKPGAGWSVQVNAFRSRDNADKQVVSLKEKGYPAFLAPGQPSGLFRVRVGPYPQRADADRMLAKLRQEGFNPSVTR